MNVENCFASIGNGVTRRSCAFLALALVIVIGRVEGRKVGRLLLEDDIAKARKADERKNLQAALKTFLAMTANER